MIDISFVQSEFQLSIVGTITPNSQVVNVRRPFRHRFFDTILACAQLISALFSRKKIAIYDHRNILAVVAVFLCKAVPSRFDCVYIGDDGLHSLVVDKYGEKYLYWRTKSFKKAILRKLKKDILLHRRIHALKDMRSYSVEGSIFIDFYSRLTTRTESPIKSAIFIDQPGVIEAMTPAEITNLSVLLGSYKDLEVIAHPRRGDDGFYKELGFISRTSPNIDAELKSLDASIDLVGYFSTVLLAGKIFGHKITPISLPVGVSEEFKGYARAGLCVIID